MSRQIMCVEGEHKGAVIEVNVGEKMVLGRDPVFCNIVYTDITISRKHCFIELSEDEEWYVTDYSSCGIVTDKEGVLSKGVSTKVVMGSILTIGKAGSKLQLN